MPRATPTRFEISSPNENPPIGTISKKNIIKNPTDPNAKYDFAVFSGRRREKTFDPSNGGIGSKLNIPRRRFSSTILNIIVRSTGLEIKSAPNLSTNAASTAIKKLVAGPARDTIAISFLPSLRLNGSTGTGLAAPKTTGEPERRRIEGKSTLIRGSM